MKVLSLFDGMACGMIAMQLAGVEVESYDAYEIDKYAIKTAQHNFPMIKEHGDVFVADFTQYEGVDFLIGGSPCTYWSIAQTKNRETVASGMGWELFSQYVRALREAKPKYFIYENNKSMSKAIRASIDETFGFEAVLINSALVSAQNRQRLYWVGKRNPDGTYSKVDVEQPEDKGILLRDILETGVSWRDKSYTLDANYYKGGNLTSLEKQDGIRNMVGNDVDRKTCVAEPVRVGTYPTSDGRLLNSQGNRIYSVDGKAVTQSAQGGGWGAKTGLYATPVRVGDMPSADGKICWSQSKRIYSIDGKAPSICATETGGNSDTSSPATRLYAEPVGIKHLGSLYGQHSRWGVFDEEGKAPTLTASAGMGGGHLPMVKEAVCLRYERTEEAKRCRKAYEAHEIKHGYNELNELHPRPDGKTNTLTTVLKDNQIMEPVCVAELGRMYCGQPQQYEARTDGKTNTLTSVEKDNRVAEPVNITQDHGCAEVLNVNPCGHGMNGAVIHCDGKCRTLTTNKGEGPKIIEPVCLRIEFDDDDKPIKYVGKDGKEITIYEVKDGKITIKGKQYPIKLRDGYYIIRKLTVRECMRLQTVPEWYEFPVSDSQAYKMLGNGWTCEVIAHLIRSAISQHIKIE